MTLKPLIGLNLLLLASLTARAQTAGDFFNSGAQFYISNNIPAALEKTENGLKLYPDDVKLKKLEELLKQQQQSQNSQSQKQQQNQKSNSQKNQEQQNSRSKQNQQSQNQSGQKQQQQHNTSQSQEKSNEEKQQAEAARTGAMTPQEAKQLLNAQKGDEQFLTLKPKEKPENQNQPVKDW
jgi:Ca-activated chloride channel homolog